MDVNLFASSLRLESHEAFRLLVVVGSQEDVLSKCARVLMHLEKEGQC
jgi:hypothetical protein